jgi:hypothetical protein
LFKVQIKLSENSAAIPWIDLMLFGVKRALEAVDAGDLVEQQGQRLALPTVT